MKLHNFLRPNSRRRIALLAASITALAVVVAMWAELGVVGGVAVATLSIISILVLKMIFEIATELKPLESELLLTRTAVEAFSDSTQQSFADLGSNQRALATTVGELKEQSSHTDELLVQRIRDVESAQSGILAALQQAEQANTSLTQRIREAEQSANRASRTDEQIVERIRPLERGLRQHTQHTEAILERVRKTERRLIATNRAVGAGRGESYQGFTRYIEPDAAEELASRWADILQIPIGGGRVQYLAHKVTAVETVAHGRFATAAEDAVIRALVAQAVSGTTARILEIGVLFAINAMYLDSVLASDFESFHQTLVDPFFGYYGNDEPDPYTGARITETVARENLDRLHVPDSRFTIVKGLSTDTRVQEKVRSGFDYVLIDGDHSYDGVASDYSWAREVVVPGGFVLFDDYRGPSWPDVTDFVDDVAMKDDRMEFVGWGARTAVFRRPV